MFNSDIDLWESTGVDSSYWHQRTKRINGIIFVVDLSSYNEYFVDENGRKRNKLEYAQSTLDHYKTLDARKLVLLTKRDVFREKVKTTPLSVCPLFAGLDGLDKFGSCIGPIREKFGSSKRNRLFIVQTSNVKEVQNHFCVFVRAMLGNY